MSLIIAQVPGRSPGPENLSLFASFLVLAFIFLPLLWWRHKAGYIGAIGILGVIGPIFGFIFIFTGGLAIDFLPFSIVAVVIEVVLIVSSAAAWKEKT